MGYVYQTSGYQGFGGIEDLVGAEAAKRLANPQQTIAEAEVLVKDLAAKGWDSVKQEAFKYAYTQGRGLLETLQKTEWGQKTTEIGNALYNVGMSGKKFVDSSGIQDKIQAADGFIKASSTLALSAGANEAVTGELTLWLGIATSCAAMIASATPLMGGIACAATVMATALTKMLKSPPRYELDPTMPAAVYVPNQEQFKHVANDALRLATLLKTHYGIASFEVLDRQFGESVNPQFFSSYPNRPPINSDGTASGGLSKPLPGADMFTLLALAAAVDHTANKDSLLRVLKLAAIHGCDTDWEEHACRGEWNFSGVAKLYDRLKMGDINVATIEVGAALARGELAIRAGTTLPSAGAWSAADGFAKPYAIEGPWFPGSVLEKVGLNDLMPFLRVDEWLNFFAAVTLGDLAVKDSPEYKGVNAYLETDKPIRVQDAPDFTVPGEPAAANQGFSTTCWTRLKRALPPALWGQLSIPEMDCQAEFRSAVLNKNPLAIKELAAIRLMSAMSHLIMLGKWQKMTSIAGIDLISTATRAAAGTTAWKFQTPVDPRQAVPKSKAEPFVPVLRPEALQGAGMQIWRHDYYGWSLHAAGKRWAPLLAKSGTPRALSGLTGEVLAAEVDKREVLMKAVAPAAYDAATRTHLALYPRTRVTTESLKTVYGLTTGAATGNLAAIKTGALQVGTLAQFEQTCRNAGGVPIWVTENGSKQGKCVPPGSPEASGGGGVALVALGAAALLALKYLK